MIAKVSATILFSALMIAGEASAALHDRGGGLLYDDVLNVTWLQDANYAKTSGYDADGRMTYFAATEWAEKLVYNDVVRDRDYNGWRLADNEPVGASWNYSFSKNGSTDWSYNITNPVSELSYMYYVNLSLLGAFTPTGGLGNNYGLFRTGDTSGLPSQTNIDLVKNIQHYRYWSGTSYPASTIYDAFFFETQRGFQAAINGYNTYYAWAVHDGDVSAVPEPESYAMLLAGLGLIGAVARRRQ